jgi:hypothetical protein
MGKIQDTELQAHLRWESGQTDPDRKPFRMIEHCAHRLQELRPLRDEYFAAFDGMTADSKDAVMARLAEMPEAVIGARQSADMLAQITRYSRQVKARGERSWDLLHEWTDMLAGRYPLAADAMLVAVHS